jgi:hypothetical protein
VGASGRGTVIVAGRSTGSLEVIANEFLVHRPWSEISARYAEDLPGLELRWMKDLVTHLEDSGKAASLYGFTSMFDLVISQTPPSHPIMPPHLRISPHPDGTLEFRYIDTYRTHEQWQRTVPGSEGVGRLERFFDQLRWFGGGAKQ